MSSADERWEEIVFQRFVASSQWSDSEFRRRTLVTVKET